LPRLVRLNPNIPWKTRGNGAIALRLISAKFASSLESDGTKLNKTQIGDIKGKAVMSYFSDKIITEPDISERLDELLEEVCGIVEASCELEEKGTNPGVVCTSETVGEELYWQAVRDIVDLEHVEKLLDHNKSSYRGYKNRRGLIGSASATAWNPESASRSQTSAPAVTYELISYREKGHWGTERNWNPLSSALLSEAIPTSFDNYDTVNKMPRIVPHTPCPVFYGVRGLEPFELKKSLEVVEVKEPVDRWVLFETNHATDDHIQSSAIPEFKPYQSVKVTGRVTDEPYVISGGHTFVKIADGQSNECLCAAYEPTKQFRDIVRNLVEGDEIDIYGGLREQTPEIDLPTVNLEKLEVLSKADIRIKINNPRCPSCGKSMKSIGKGQGYRCRRCGQNAGEEAAEVKFIDRKLVPGFYETAPSARRHLSCPLELYKIG
jgi:tRNA(Ile2)-agmatinylcytidine synthase